MCAQTSVEVWLSPCNGSMASICNAKSFDTCKLLILDV